MISIHQEPLRAATACELQEPGCAHPSLAAWSRTSTPMVFSLDPTLVTNILGKPSFQGPVRHHAPVFVYVP